MKKEVKQKIKEAKENGIEMNEKQATKLVEIIEICKNNRLIKNRFKELSKSGYYINECPMVTGGGICNYIQMKTGSIRVRISANWGGKYGNYANCVHI